MTAAIYYHPDAYSSQGPKLMGRNAAGESFLRGFVAHQTSKEIYLYAAKEALFSKMKELSDDFGITNFTKFLSPVSHGALQEPGTLFYPGPDIGHQAFLRSSFGHASWSLCGITHTTSSAGAMDALCDLITAPIQPWDAVICTSHAVKKNVETVLQGQVDYLKDRLGITKIILPQLPVIPLGINTADFEFKLNVRQQSRKQLAIEDTEIVVLYVGRLSFHAKAHPFPMYLALERSAATTGKKITLIECGWFANNHIEKAFSEGAEKICPSIRRIVLDGRDPSQRQLAWSSADIFCSLSDNIQETFGITPIEAMAAGLPVVVSDWDGYKDTVRDGVDGFRISTLMPHQGLGGDIAIRHALGIDTYDMYCGHTSSFVSVDIDATFAAFRTLIENAELRQKMGDEGRARAQSIYDWKYIIAAYEELWSSLNVMRVRLNIQGAKISVPWPARLDPFSAFGNYPSRVLSPNTEIQLFEPDCDKSMESFRKLKELTIANYTSVFVPRDDDALCIMTSLTQGPQEAIKVIESTSVERRAIAFRSIGWLIKFGLIKI